MYKAYKYRLYPNKEQRKYFIKTFGAVRFIYNQMLANRIELFNKYGNNSEEFKKHKPRLYTSYKKEYLWLYEIDNQALAYAQMNLQNAYKRFYNEGRGFPNFKSKKNSKDSFKTNNAGNKIHIKNGKIRLPKIGYIKIKQHRDFDGIIKFCVVSRTKTDKYYVSVTVDCEKREWEKIDSKIGIDLGLTHFAISTNDKGISEKYYAPKYLRKSEIRLKKSDQNVSRKKLGSKNREKARLKHAKLHEKVTNQRKDFLHKLSHKIVSENQAIAIETLRSSNLMQNHSLAKSIQDASWYEFTRQLEYKSEWYGRSLTKADRYYPSSQICSECGHNGGKKKLDVREWTCSECGAYHDRDINAAKNLLNLII